MAKTKYRYNHKTEEWDHIIKNFMGILGLTFVTQPHEKHYPSNNNCIRLTKKVS